MNLNVRSPFAIKTFAVRAAEYISLIAPAMLILAALSIWFAVTQAQKAITSGRQSIANDATQLKAPSLTQRPLPATGYGDAVAVLAAANPAVKVSLGKNKDSVIVAVTDPALMPEWFYLLSTVQSYRGGLIWTANRICLKKCDAGQAAFAEIRAYTQEVSIAELTS
jgi:hypothetical protein